MGTGQKIGVPPNSRYSSARKTLFIFWIWYQPFSGDNFDLSTTPAEKPRSCTWICSESLHEWGPLANCHPVAGLQHQKHVFLDDVLMSENGPQNHSWSWSFSRKPLVWGFPYFSLPSFQTPRAWGPHPPVLVATRGRSPRLPSSTPRITRWMIWMVYMIPCG